MRRAAALGLGALLVAACAGTPDVPTTAVRLTTPPKPPTRPAQSPTPGQAQAPGAPTAPDRSEAQWSRTAVPLLGIGEVDRRDTPDGTAWRIGTTRGVVEVWQPTGLLARTAGVVVYLHGYFTNVDQAMADHRLLDQFRESGRNAVFIVPESPAWNGEEGVWPDLGLLLDEVARQTRRPLPRGPLVVAGHSGAFRPILSWLSHPRLEEVLLLDGLYRGEDLFKGWLDQTPRGAFRRLVLVSDETLPKGELLASAVPGSVSLPSVPPPDAPLEGAARTTRLLHLRSQHPHMAIVENGEVLPLLLRATRLPALRSAP